MVVVIGGSGGGGRDGCPHGRIIIIKLYIISRHAQITTLPVLRQVQIRYVSEHAQVFQVATKLFG